MTFRKATLFALLIVLSPILLAFLSSLISHGSFMSENSSGAYLWLLFLSIPLGFFFLLANLLVRLLRMRRGER
jgi:hypothetical protein